MVEDKRIVMDILLGSTSSSVTITRIRFALLLFSLFSLSIAFRYLSLYDFAHPKLDDYAHPKITRKLRAPTDTEESHKESSSKILYVIRSFPGRYRNRLSLQAQTWMRHLDPVYEGILVASVFTPGWTYDRAWNATGLSHASVDVHFSTPWCSENNHGVGLCCQEALALVQASQMDDSYDWVFVIDEDVFVNPSLIRRVASKHSDSPKQRPVTVGTLGCGEGDVFGFCGGGGYLISQSALRRLVATPDFYETYMDRCRTKIQYCDIVTAYMMKQSANVSLVQENSFHPWGVTEQMIERQVDVNYDLFLQRVASYRQHPDKNVNTPFLMKPSIQMIDDLEQILVSKGKLSNVLALIQSEEISTLHYYGGGILTEHYKSIYDKMAFLQLLFDIGLPAGPVVDASSTN